MNNPEPTPDHAELAVTGMGISLIVAMFAGIMALFFNWRIGFLASCFAMLVLAWSMTMLIAQYAASLRHDVFASRVICIQWTCNTAFALIALVWYTAPIIVRHGFDVSELGFTFFSLVLVIPGCVVFTVGNWRWRSVLLEAAEQGMTASPWNQLTIADIMAATLVIAIMLGTFRFLFGA